MGLIGSKNFHTIYFLPATAPLKQVPLALVFKRVSGQTPSTGQAVGAGLGEMLTEGLASSENVPRLDVQVGAVLKLVPCVGKDGS